MIDLVQRSSGVRRYKLEGNTYSAYLVRASVCCILNAISCCSICRLTLSISNLALFSSFTISALKNRKIGNFLGAVWKIMRSYPKGGDGFRI